MDETNTLTSTLRMAVFALLMLGLVLGIGLLVAATDFSAIALNPQPEPPG